jgi:type I restriction enzyme S subunit
MGKYSNLVKTNEAWLPMIPSQWNMKKIKWSFKERSQKGFPDEPLLVASQNMGVVPKNIYGKRTVEALKDLDKLKLVKVGDYVVSLRSFQGGIEYAYYQGIISPAYTIMQPTPDFSSTFYKFLFKSSPFIKLLTTCVTGIREGQNIDYGKLKNHYIPVPPRAEQDQIVRFLDWKVSEINKLIGIRRKEIQELEELKKVLILKVITGKMQNIEMKETSVKWIGRIPKKWNLRHVKDVANITNGSDPKTNGDIPVYGSGEGAFKTCGEYKEGPTVLIGRKGATLHIPHYIKGKYWNVDTAFDVHMKNNNDLRWFYYLAQCFDYQYYISQTTLPSMTQTDYNNMTIPIPPIDVQKKIVVYLDQEYLWFNHAINVIRKKVELLNELKSTLISDVVTGKIDVRNIPVPAYEHVEDMGDDAGEGNEEKAGILGEED